MTEPEKERTFKVLRSLAERRFADGCPTEVPWAMVEPHRRQAYKNHMQTLERLDERGGLAPSELVAVLEDREWVRLPDHDAVRLLKEKLAAFRAGGG